MCGAVIGGRLAGMELILMVLLPFPVGYFLKSRLAAYVVYTAAHSFVFTVQTMTLLRAWVGGDRSAFAADPTSPEWPYAAVNLAIYAAGLGLLWLGHRVGAGRRAKQQAVAEPAL
jgi:hypothetical protein